MKQKTWEELGITNNFIFGKVMQNTTICKELLEIILDIKIERIEYPTIEKSIAILHDYKSVRLDVYVADGRKTVYNIEMQASDTKEIPMRSRFYQSIIDIELIEKGQSYNTLGKSFVIFICNFDLFGQGRYRYTFEERCIEDTTLKLNDGTAKIFLNAKGILEDDAISDDLRAFLEYVNGIPSENEFVQKVSAEIDTIKQNKDWGIDYMNRMVSEHLCRAEGYNAGIADGHSNGLLQGLLQGEKVADVKFVRKMIDGNMEFSEISKVLGLERLYVDTINELILDYPEESDLELAERLSNLVLTYH